MVVNSGLLPFFAVPLHDNLRTTSPPSFPQPPSRGPRTRGQRSTVDVESRGGLNSLVIRSRFMLDNMA
jgi:hypothetical protein